MATHAQSLLHAKIYQLLKADATLVALVTDRIYDWVPDNSPMPYVALGTPISEDWSSHTFDGFEFTFTIHAFTESAGRKDAMTIANRIYALLHNVVDLALSGFSTVSCRQALCQVSREEDGKTHHAFMQYRIILGGSPT